MFRFNLYWFCLFLFSRCCLTSDAVVVSIEIMWVTATHYKIRKYYIWTVKIRRVRGYAKVGV